MTDDLKAPRGWNDITSYRRGDKERIPSVWSLRLTSEVRISVIRSHRLEPEYWVMHCDPWFDTYSLGLPSTLENRDEAMSRAVALVRAEIDKLATAIRGIN